MIPDDITPNPLFEFDPELVAENLYTVYCKEVGGVAFNGDALPNWKEFRADPSKAKQSNAWVAVAKEAMDIGLE